LIGSQTEPPLPAHPPQLLGSLDVLAHVLPQTASPAGHVQALWTQLAPAGQPWLQLPQLFGSLVVSTHLPLQAMTVGPHTHVPFWQTAPAPMLAAHAWSTAGSSSTMPLQSSSFPLQVSGA
jgi:hypothetical protein